MGQGQWRISRETAAALNEVDARLDQDIVRGAEAELDLHLEEMHRLVQASGTRVPPEELVPSDAVIPPAGSSLAELRELAGEQGLVPG